MPFSFQFFLCTRFLVLRVFVCPCLPPVGNATLCPPSFKSHSPAFLLRLVAEWVKDIDYTAKSWTVELELVYLYWIMHQHCDSHNILRNVSIALPFALLLIIPPTPPPTPPNFFLSDRLLDIPPSTLIPSHDPSPPPPLFRVRSAPGHPTSLQQGFGTMTLPLRTSAKTAYCRSYFGFVTRASRRGVLLVSARSRRIAPPHR